MFWREDSVDDDDEFFFDEEPPTRWTEPRGAR
jgi:hypothetical protein